MQDQISAVPDSSRKNGEHFGSFRFVRRYSNRQPMGGIPLFELHVTFSLKGPKYLGKYS
jgi:hypothetical protein